MTTENYKNPLALISIKRKEEKFKIKIRKVLDG